MEKHGGEFGNAAKRARWQPSLPFERIGIQALFNHCEPFAMMCDGLGDSECASHNDGYNGYKQRQGAGVKPFHEDLLPSVRLVNLNGFY